MFNSGGGIKLYVVFTVSVDDPESSLKRDCEKKILNFSYFLSMKLKSRYGYNTVDTDCENLRNSVGLYWIKCIRLLLVINNRLFSLYLGETFCEP